MVKTATTVKEERCEDQKTGCSDQKSCCLYKKNFHHFRKSGRKKNAITCKKECSIKKTCEKK